MSKEGAWYQADEGSSRIPAVWPASRKYGVAHGRQGHAPMYTNEHYTHALFGGRTSLECPPTNHPIPTVLCLLGAPSHPLRRAPCRQGDLGPTAHTAGLPVGARSEGPGLPGGTGHCRPSSPRHLYPEPQPRDTTSFRTCFSSLRGDSGRGASTLASASRAPHAAGRAGP